MAANLKQVRGHLYLCPSLQRRQARSGCWSETVSSPNFSPSYYKIGGNWFVESLTHSTDVSLIHSTNVWPSSILGAVWENLDLKRHIKHSPRPQIAQWPEELLGSPMARLTSGHSVTLTHLETSQSRQCLIQAQTPHWNMSCFGTGSRLTPHLAQKHLSTSGLLRAFPIHPT